MSGKKGFFALVLIILLAYLSAWLMVYQQSKRYFDFAEQRYAAGDYILALKGMNKIELYRHDVYSGGYQQVIDDWRHGMLVYRPDFYYQALARSSDLLARASDQHWPSLLLPTPKLIPASLPKRQLACWLATGSVVSAQASGRWRNIWPRHFPPMPCAPLRSSMLAAIPIANPAMRQSDREIT